MQNPAVEQAMLGAAQKIEQALDDEINKLDQLGDDDLESIRRRRIAQMKREAENDQRWRRNGHGQLRDIKEKEFFTHSKESERFLCIFHRPAASVVSKDFTEHVARIAEAHVETMFGSLDAEKAPFLVDKFSIQVLPALVQVANGQVRRVLHGLSELAPTGKFDTVALEQKLFDLEIVTDTRIADSR